MPDYGEMRRLADELRRKIDRADGQSQRVMQEIESEFGCASVEEAEALLKRLERDKDRAERKAEDALRKFRERWADKLAKIV